MAETHRGICWNDAALDRHRHVCVFYHGHDEEYRLLRSFIEDGFRRRDKGFHIIDARRRQDHMRRLCEFGIDVAAAEETGQLEVRGWEDAHLQPGWFDQHSMLSLVEDVLTGARSQGFPFTRWVANMGWALEERRGVEDLVEYCVRLNDVVPKYEATVICTYDLTRFTASQAIDVLRSHPVAVIGGIIQENPYFVPPDELLRELRQDRRDPLGTA
jgi:MEDS: MEthanogen/methylotroph, DcmR Sensory domain